MFGKFKISWPAVGSAAVWLLGLITSPAVLGTVSAHTAGVLIALGGIGQMVTKAIVHDPATGGITGSSSDPNATVVGSPSQQLGSYVSAQSNQSGKPVNPQ